MAPKKQAKTKKKDEPEEDSGSEDIVSGPSEDEQEGHESDDGNGAGPRDAGHDSDKEGSDFSELQVDFEFFDLTEIDFHGIRALLSRYLDGEEWDMSGMSDALIAQAASVGTAIKANGDVDPVGICSVLALDESHRIPSVEQVIKFVRNKCPEDIRHKLDKALTTAGTGLVINERLINAPPELGPPLISGLFTEVSEVGEPWWWETEKRASDALLASLRFKRYLILTRVYRDDNADAVGAGPATGGEGSAQQGKGKGKAAAAAQKEQKIVYPKPEDNALHQLASWSHLWPAAVPEATAASDAQSKLTQMRLVMLVDASAADATVKTTQAIVDALSAEEDDFVSDAEEEGVAPAKKIKTGSKGAATGGTEGGASGGGKTKKGDRGGAVLMTAVRGGGGGGGASSASGAGLKSARGNKQGK